MFRYIGNGMKLVFIKKLDANFAVMKDMQGNMFTVNLKDVENA